MQTSVSSTRLKVVIHVFKKSCLQRQPQQQLPLSAQHDLGEKKKKIRQ